MVGLMSKIFGGWVVAIMTGMPLYTSMALASLLSISAYLGLFGEMAQAFSALIGMGTALIASPLIALATRGKYYLARPAESHPAQASDASRLSATADAGSYQRLSVQRCVICERVRKAR